MKIFVSPTSFLKPENSKARAKLEEFADEVVYNDLGIPLKGKDLLERLQGVDGYIAGLDYITADVVQCMPDSLKVISRYGSGVDRVDIEACRKRNIIVTNTPGVNAVAVCELTFALMLSIARNIPSLHGAVEKGQWPRNNGVELCGKTLGIIGMGAIGKEVAVRAKAFNMDVLAYDPYFDKKFAEKHGIRYNELDSLLQNSDIVSLHLPLTNATRHIIGKEQIEKMKKGAIIINTSRGGLIDESALVEALKADKLFGAGLDAFENEPLEGSSLIGLPNVVLTPHTGAHTKEAIAKMGMMAVDNLIAILTGEKCDYIVK